MAAIALRTARIRFGPMVTPLPRLRPRELALEAAGALGGLRARRVRVTDEALYGSSIPESLWPPSHCAPRASASARWSRRCRASVRGNWRWRRLVPWEDFVRDACG